MKENDTRLKEELVKFRKDMNKRVAFNKAKSNQNAEIFLKRLIYKAAVLELFDSSVKSDIEELKKYYSLMQNLKIEKFLGMYKDMALAKGLVFPDFLFGEFLPDDCMEAIRQLEVTMVPLPLINEKFLNSYSAKHSIKSEKGYKTAFQTKNPQLLGVIDELHREALTYNEERSSNPEVFESQYPKGHYLGANLVGFFVTPLDKVIKYNDKKTRIEADNVQITFVYDDNYKNNESNSPGFEELEITNNPTFNLKITRRSIAHYNEVNEGIIKKNQANIDLAKGTYFYDPMYKLYEIQTTLHLDSELYSMKRFISDETLKDLKKILQKGEENLNIKDDSSRKIAS